VTVKLDYHIVKSVVNAFFGLFVGRRTRPIFFRTTEACPELDHVTRAYPAIRREVWKEGEAVLFDDSWPHSVVNHSQELRAVLIVDVRRPMPLVADLCNRFITDVVARHTYGRSVVRKSEAFVSARGAKRQVAA
jgi:hypothetical protein